MREHAQAPGDGTLGTLRRRLADWIRPEDPAITRIRSLVARTETAQWPVEGPGLWATTPVHFPRDYATRMGRAKILAVGNLKGGVGKTTLTGNLGACLAARLSRPVLMVDLDFQGSLSSMAVQGTVWQPPDGQNAHATHLVSGDIHPLELVSRMTLRAEGVEGLYVMPAWYDLGLADNRLLIEWLLADPAAPAEDRRYWLFDALHHPRVQDTYGLILLDLPPRLTMGHVQALCAASHLMIPTIMDRVSTEAVLSYTVEIERLRGVICPHLAFLGVVGSKWMGHFTKHNDALGALEARIAALMPGRLPIAPIESFLPNLTFFAGDGIAYAGAERNPKARAAVETLADWVSMRMDLE